MSTGNIPKELLKKRVRRIIQDLLRSENFVSVVFTVTINYVIKFLTTEK